MIEHAKLLEVLFVELDPLEGGFSGALVEVIVRAIYKSHEILTIASRMNW